jgi:hypothetical protein
MAPQAAPPSRPAGTLFVLRSSMAAAGIFLAVLALGGFTRLHGEQQDSRAWLAQSGQPIEPRLAREIAREPDADGLAVKTVRASLAREIDALAHSTPDRRESAARLAETARRAAAALAHRPASWEAAMVLGAATYMSGSQGRDSRLFTEHQRWEEPLQAALRLAPSKREPVRFLAGAYLEIWPALSPPKREAARRLVAQMLRDSDDLDLILGPWLDAAGDRRTAFSAVPAEPRAWDKVQRLLAQRGDWQGFSEARGHWDRLLYLQLQGDVDKADSLLTQGDIRGARSLFLSVLEQARPDLAYRDLLNAALTRCPPGPVSRETSAVLARQLDWAVERCLLADCALPPPALKRLAHLTGDAALPQEATALLLSGDTPGAQVLERRADSGWGDAWGPYLVLKARTLIKRQEFSEATATLDFVPRSWWDRPTYWQARVELARAANDNDAAQRAAERLREMTHRSWPATAWTQRQDRARLEMLTGAPAGGLEVDFAGIPPGGAVVELRLDGALLGAATARPTLGLNLPLGPGLHLLEVESLGGGNLVPGEVRLR